MNNQQHEAGMRRKRALIKRARTLFDKVDAFNTACLDAGVCTPNGHETYYQQLWAWITEQENRP